LHRQRLQSSLLDQEIEETIKTSTQTILVTGGAGFIGTNFIRHTLSKHPNWRIVNLDAVTYAGNPANLADLTEKIPERYNFVHGDISDGQLVEQLFVEEQFDGVIHFAAESHVDRSIHGPIAFAETNVLGTCRLLSACSKAWEQQRRPDFRFLHVSTDEVYGSLGSSGFFLETTPYDPSSPYSAPGIEPTGCLLSLRIARIITAPINFLKNCFH